MAYSRSSAVSHLVVAGKSGRINLSVSVSMAKCIAWEAAYMAMMAKPTVRQPSTEPS